MESEAIDVSVNWALNCPIWKDSQLTQERWSKLSVVNMVISDTLHI